MERFSIAGFRIQFRDVDVGTRDTVSIFLNPHSNLVLFRAVLVDKTLDVNESSNRAASHLEAGISSLSTDMNNQGSPEIPSNISNLVFPEEYGNMTKKEPDQIHQNLSAPSLNDAIGSSLLIGHSKNTYQTSLQGEIELPHDDFIQAIIDQRNADVLEAGVAEAPRFLTTLKHCFAQHTTTIGDAQSWVESIDKLCLHSKRKRTIIGVVGNTGAGKSSVINAMLDEERLLPTNCMRACTAVVTEVSWNSSENLASKYRAKIEFITPDDWTKEFTIISNDLLADNGKVCREASDLNTDAGIAWAKFHAVYPRISRDSLDRQTLTDLMAESELKVLGTTKTIEAAEPADFYRELQKYVDSRQKANRGKAKKRKAYTMEIRKRRSKKREHGQKTQKRSHRSMEFWPLIKVVKIYTKAQALSTGTVIVDLPGVHDSNTARSAVAQRYMQQCTGLWIVAPITRAVDDKAAKTLLGESFKMQLKYDGGFSGVTFICSKTDDISITEAIEALDIQKDVAHLREQEHCHQQTIETIQSRILDLEQSNIDFQAALNDTLQELDEWMDLQEKLNHGMNVFAPAPRTDECRTSTSERPALKRIRNGDQEISSADDNIVDEVVVVKPLQGPDIEAKVKRLLDTSKNIRQKATQIQPELRDLKARIRDLNNDIGSIRLEVGRICISGRNEFSKSAIKKDFAAGIKELDQEIAMEADEYSFNPDEETRDYDEMARALPVFCVSSRAYQHQCGRFQQDDTVPGFTTLEETEMPQLQSHCQDLTKADRVQIGRSYLLSLRQHIKTLELWASDDVSGSKLTEEDEVQQRECIGQVFIELESGLQEISRVCINHMRDTMNSQIFSKYPSVINEAIELAPETVERWGAKPQDGGLPWATYRAVIRRNGKYQSPMIGERDFNTEL
jgi:uncharacterized protein YlxW (UPF0749 family)